MAEEKSSSFRTMWGARILWPSDMSDDVLESAVMCAQNQLGGESNLNPDRDGAQICSNIKAEFDERWGPSWVVVCGKNFGCHAIHEKHMFIYFYIGQYAFMYYKVPA